jgi:hypothetical protein
MYWTNKRDQKGIRGKLGRLAKNREMKNSRE